MATPFVALRAALEVPAEEREHVKSVPRAKVPRVYYVSRTAYFVGLSGLSVFCLQQVTNRAPISAGSNPAPATNITWSIPVTWVTVHSEHIGNTFGPNGFSIGSSRHVSSSKYPKS